MSAADPVGRAAAKLAAARARLILERPFLGALTMHLPLVASSVCRTLATDARAIYFNPEHVLALSLAHAQFVLAHQALHCALGHFARRAHRLSAHWNAACDYAVNALLAADGMKPPPDALWNADWSRLSAEEIYPLLVAPSGAATLDEHWFEASDAGGIDQPSVSRSDIRVEGDAAALDSSGVALLSHWQQRLAGAALEASKAGRLGAHWNAVAESVLQPTLPWPALLQRFMSAIAHEDYSFARRSRREAAALLPGRQSGEAQLVVALDTSGSISREQCAEFLAEVNALKAHVRARVTLLACDAALAPGSPWRFEPWDALDLPEGLRGGGGTRFTPVFDWVSAQPLRPDALVYFTDALGEFPERAPEYPVLWLVQGRAPVPFGERVQLN
jgi:predicted metal-dependent peptidase